MKILFTGNYLPSYNRTKIIRKGLEELGHQVREFPFAKKNSQTQLELLEAAAAVDFIYMPPFTHKEVCFVRKLVGQKFIAFDPLISRYLTKVYDYKLVWPWSFSALRNFYRDKWPLQAADFIFTDTLAHKNYFHKSFGIGLEKMSPLYIGNDFEDFYPAEQKGSDKFKVGFYGGFIPLQGVMNILKAAVLLKDNTDIQFELIGSGFEFDKAKAFVQKQNLVNVHLPGWLEEAELRERIQAYDMCLGIFGTTIKSDLVIPNKVYHYAGCGKAILSKDSTAIRELFTTGENIELCGTDPQSIAQGIEGLKSRGSYRIELGKNAYKFMKSSYAAPHIAAQFLDCIKPRLK